MHQHPGHETNPGQLIYIKMRIANSMERSESQFIFRVQQDQENCGQKPNQGMNPIQ